MMASGHGTLRNSRRAAPDAQVLRPVRRRNGMGDQVVCQHGAPVALQALLQRPGVLPAAQKHDPAVPQPMEILGRLIGPLLIVHLHIAAPGTVVAA